MRVKLYCNIVKCNRHCRQTADLPAKVAKRIGCARKRGCSSEIGWSPIFVKILGHEFLVIILGHEFLVNFMSPFHARQLILPCARRGHVIFQGIPVYYIAIGLLKQTNYNKCSSKTGIFYLERKGTVKYAVEEEAPFLCQLDCSLTLLDVEKAGFRCHSTYMT